MESLMKKSLKRKLRRSSHDGDETGNIKSVRLESDNDDDSADQRDKDDARSSDYNGDEPVCDKDTISGTGLNTDTRVLCTKAGRSVNEDESAESGGCSTGQNDGSSRAASPQSTSASACSDTATEEEKIRFAFISQQLDILNTDSLPFAPVQTKLLPKSPAKSVKSSIQTKKITKRKGLKIKIGLTEKHRLAVVKKAILSPRKRKNVIFEPPPSPKETSESSDQGELTPSGTSESGDTSIDGESAEDRGVALEKKKTDIKSPVDVKRIINRLVTDGSVLELIRSSVQASDGASTDCKEAGYEPKQTRSQTKVGDPLFPWVLSQVKKSLDPKPNILDLTFSEEEEEDDEYQPDKETETENTDSESMLSPQMSDLGSISPPNPSTPPSDFLMENHSAQSQTEAKSPDSSDGKPSAHPSLETYHQNTADQSSSDHKPETVALRTRSKVTLTDKSLHEIESIFVAPDITTDMYQTAVDDPDWTAFLSGLQAPLQLESDNAQDAVDDENTDPEYNFQAEAEVEEQDTEDLRNDMAIKISKKELSELLDELLTESVEEDQEEEILKKKIKGTSSGNCSSSSEGRADSSDQEDVAKGYLMWTSESGELTESDEAGLEIAEEVETDLDKRLEAEAQKNNLTAINVKNLLHHIVTNEHVLDMVKNSLASERDPDVKEAAYEPKMTRSKTKVGISQPLFPWVMSPGKKLSDPKPSIMDLTFSEEEDEDEDEEYEPDKDPEAMDTDTDSVVSSRMSDFGSPCPTTPSTPGFGSAPCKDGSRLSKKDSEGFQSPMNPPSAPGRLSAARQLGRKFQDAMDKANDEDGPETVAHRTRSKVPLTDKSLFELESSFVAPDITADMYQIENYDPDWLNFLTGLQAPPTESEDTHDAADDETNDPEYNFLAEAEEEEPDKEDFRNDKATKVTKKELNELLDELLAAYGDGEEEKDKKEPCRVSHPPPIPRLQKALPPPESNCRISMTADEQEQLSDQLTKHVQLLTQVFLLCHRRVSHHNYAKRCRVFLNELKQLGSLAGSCRKSSFHTCNLDSALNLINSPLPQTRDLERPVKLRNQRPVCAGLTDEVKTILRTKAAFSFPHLLPISNFFSHHVACMLKVMFTPAEDRLIAMGLEDFSSFEKTKYKLIHDNLLPCKTVNQIKCRVKNQVARKDDNVIKNFWKDGVLPIFPKSTELNTEDAAAPEWYQHACHKELKASLERPRAHSITRSESVHKEVEKALKIPRRTRRPAQSAPVSPDLPAMTAEKFVKSAVISDEVKKLSNVPPEGNRSAVVSSLSVSKIPVRLVHLGDNKAVISSLSCDQVMPVLDGSSNAFNTGLAGIPVLASDSSKPDSGLNMTMPSKKSQASVIKISDVTCVARSFLISQAPVTAFSSLSSTTTLSTAQLNIPCVSSMIPLSEVAAKSPSSGEATPSRSPAVPMLSPNQVVRTKSAVEIMAEVAPFLTSPRTAPSIELDQRTPPKKSSRLKKSREQTSPSEKLPRLVPSPHTSPSKHLVLPFVLRHKQRNSPRRQQLKQKAKAILPKGFIMRSEVVSPVKKAASKVTSKARKVQRTLLPKLVPSGSVVVVDTRPAKCVRVAESMEVKSECATVESEKDPELGQDGASKHTQETAMPKEEKTEKHGGTVSGQRDSADSQSEGEGTGGVPYDSQTEEEEGGADDSSIHLQELMEASTTIRHPAFPPKKQGLKDRRSKAQKHKDTTLAMLNPDIIQADPIRDDRDIAFAQAYLSSVKTALKDDDEKYGKFLQILYEFGKNQGSPVELYEQVKTLLEDHPHLVEDFSGFLLPEQAVKCGCYMANQQYHKARSFLRKLEIHFEKHPSHFQKIIKTFCQWRPGQSPSEIQTLLLPLLKGQQHLLEEFSLFFENERPPESHITDYEEIDLCDSDQDEDRYLDGFEEVELSDEADHHGTKRCECTCHDTKADAKFFKREKHCNACGLKIIGGKLYFRTTGKNLVPAVVVYHKSFWMDEQRQSAEVNSCTLYNEDRSSALTSVESIVEENGLLNKLPHKLQTKRPPVRKRIKPITLRAVPQGSRFIALDDLGETQDSSSVSWIPVAQSDTSGKTTDSRKKIVTIGETGAKSLQDGVGRLPGKSNVSRGTEGSARESGIKTDIRANTRTVEVQKLPKVAEVVAPPSEVAPSAPESGAVSDSLSSNPALFSFGTSGLFPSPCKDSNSSSGDILAKAMKVAHVTKSDIELSSDQSLMLPGSPSTTGACVPGEVTSGESISRMDFSSNPVLDSSQGTQEPIWTKDADRLILEMCKSAGPSDTTFQGISKQLTDKSETQVRERFGELMSLLKKSHQGDGVGTGETCP